MSRYLLLFGSTMIAIGLYVTPGALTDWQLARDSAYWPSTDGVVISSKSTLRSSGKGSQYVVAIEYRYRIDELTYRGNDLRPGTDSMTFHDAKRTVGEYPATAKVRVHYSPKNPTQALLLPGMWSGIYLNLGVSTFCVLVGSLLVVTFFRRTKAHRPV